MFGRKKKEPDIVPLTMDSMEDLQNIKLPEIDNPGTRLAQRLAAQQLSQQPNIKTESPIIQSPAPQLKPLPMPQNNTQELSLEAQRIEIEKRLEEIKKAEQEKLEAEKAEEEKARLIQQKESITVSPELIDVLKDFESRITKIESRLFRVI